MKKSIFVFLIAAAFITSLVSCASGANTPKFSDVSGKNWKLIEVYIDGMFDREIILDRDVLSQEGNTELYTLNFDVQMVSGLGAPNRYSAPFTVGDSQSVNIMPMRSTMMAAIFAPERLPEHQFFGFLQNAYKWEIDNGNLILLSRTEEHNNVRMVFGL